MKKESGKWNVCALSETGFFSFFSRSIIASRKMHATETCFLFIVSVLPSSRLIKINEDLDLLKV